MTRMAGKLLFPLMLLFMAGVSHGTELKVTVRDTNDKLLSDAVVTLKPVDRKLVLPKAKSVIIDQINKEFVHHVTPVLVGTPVYFPNKDNIRHHVYSFSQAKEFELPLYKGTPADPVVFDKPGVVKLGCNIHDWMLGYVYVVDTPYYALTTESGFVIMHGLPKGTYKARIWHPDMPDEAAATEQTVVIGDGAQQKLDFRINIRKSFRIRRAPMDDGLGY